VQLRASIATLRLAESFGIARGTRTEQRVVQVELEVLLLVAEGRTNREIGQTLFMSEKTASVHVSRILAKLDVGGRVEAAAIAHRLGLTAAAS